MNNALIAELEAIEVVFSKCTNVSIDYNYCKIYKQTIADYINNPSCIISDEELMACVLADELWVFVERIQFGDRHAASNLANLLQSITKIPLSANWIEANLPSSVEAICIHKEKARKDWGYIDLNDPNEKQVSEQEDSDIAQKNGYYWTIEVYTDNIHTYDEYCGSSLVICFGKMMKDR